MVDMKDLKSFEQKRSCGFDSHLWYTFLGSSAVEHSAVNRTVPGSNPGRGAKYFL